MTAKNILRKIDGNTVAAYMESLKSDSGLSPTSVNRKRAALSKFFDFATAKNYTTNNPLHTTTYKSLLQQSKGKPKTPYDLYKEFLCVGAVMSLLFLIGVGINRRTQPFLQRLLAGQNISQSVVAATTSWTLPIKTMLITPDGTKIASPSAVIFRLYDDLNATEPLWVSSERKLTPDANGEITTGLGLTGLGDNPIPSDFFFKYDILSIEPSIEPYGKLPKIPVSTAANSANSLLLDRYAASLDAFPLTIPVVNENGEITLSADAPTLRAPNGRLKLEGQGITIAAAPFSNESITIAPDGDGTVNFRLSGTTGNQIDIHNSNITTGNLLYAAVGNDTTGYNLLDLQSGATPSSQFRVDARGNTTIAGTLTVGHLGNLGDLRVQNNATILGTLDVRSITTATGNLIIKPTDKLDLQTKIINSGSANSGRVYIDDVLHVEGGVYSRSILNSGPLDSDTITTIGEARLGDATNDTVYVAGQMRMGQFATNPTAVATGAMIYNTTDNSMKYWNGSSWSTLTTDLFTDAGTITYLTATTDDFALGGTTLADSMFALDESAGTFYFGYDNSANPTFNFEATDSDAGEFGFNTNDSFYFNNATVGIGVTNPSQALHVVGQCVTGDTKLTTTEGQSLRVDAVRGGEYVYSLDQETGKLVPAKIETLLDMGVKPVFELTTEDGKKIRTTGNHPYLIQDASGKPIEHTSPINGAGWIKVINLQVGDKIAVTNRLFAGTSTNFDNQGKSDEHQGISRTSDPQKFSQIKVVDHKNSSSILAAASIDNVAKNNEYVNRIKTSVNERNPKIPGKIIIDPNQPAAKLDKTADITFNLPGVKNLITNESTKNSSDVKWDTIVSIKYVGEEQVYDLSIEGTHNFVGNGIVAHNTYINSTATTADVKGLEIDQSGAVTGTGYGLHVEKTGISTTNVGGYFSASGATNNYGLIVENGSVGIGTTSPIAQLHLSAETGTVANSVYIDKYEGAPNILGRRANGTTAIPTQVLSGDQLFGFGARPYFSDTANFSSASLGSSAFFAAENLTSTAKGTYFSIYTTTIGNNTLAERFRISDSGNVGIGTTAPDARLEINHATGDSLRLTYNDSDGSATNYTDFSLGTTGDLTITGSAASVASAVGAEKTFLTLTPATITLTGTTQVTSQMDSYLVNRATIAGDTATVTVDDAATLVIAGPPAEGSNVSLTEAYGLKINTAATTATTAYGLYVDAPSGAGANYAAIFNGGNVGIGVTNPSVKLHVVGECVAAGTKIRRRRRRKGKNGQWIDDPPSPDGFGGASWDEIPVEDIKSGDEILSFNDQTGNFEWHTVEKTLNKGLQKVFALTTTGGKRILTTANHPYFTISKPLITYGVFEVDQSIRIEDLGSPTVIGFALGNITFTAVLHQRLKKNLLRTYQKVNTPNFFGPKTFAHGVIEVFKAANIYPAQVTIDTEYTGYEHEIRRMFSSYFPQTEIVFQPIGKRSLAHEAVILVHRGKKGADVQLEQKENDQGLQALRALSPRTGYRGSSRPHGHFVPLSYYTTRDLSRGKWTKVAQLARGMYIATSDGWEKIANIQEIGTLPTYDLQIEATHNFVGNGIVAHNTYINSTATTADVKGLEIDQSGAVSGTGYGLHVEKTGISTTNVGGYFSASGATNNYGLLVENGSVGIGTVSPAFKLDTQDTTTAGRFLVNNGGVGIVHALQLDVNNSLSVGAAGLGPALSFRGETSTTESQPMGRIAAVWSDATHSTRGAYLGFYTTYNGTANNERMRIDSAGNVGIGTTAPDAALEINHATGDSLRLTYNDADGSATNYTDFSLDSTGGLTLTGSAATLGASATAKKTFLTLTPGTITLTAPTQVTSLMETSVLTGATIAADAATTVDKATTLSLTAPIDSTNTTITADSALRILNVTSGTGTLTNQYGLFIEDLTAGASDYGIYIAGADSYSLYTAAGSVAHVFEAGESLTLDAATTDNTGTAGIIDLNLDTTSSQAGIDVDAETITDAGADTVSGIKVTATQTSTDDDVLYGLHVANLAGTPDAGAEYGIYQAGTSWDYGAVFEDDIKVARKTEFTPSATQTLAVGDPIVVSATHLKVAGSGGAVTLTSAPTIADGTEGDFVIIRGTHNTNTVTLQDQGTLASSNLELGSTGRALGNGDTLGLLFDGTVWVETWFSGSIDADFAEFYQAEADVAKGDVVALSSSESLKVHKATTVDGQRIVGIISTQPAYLLGNQFHNRIQMPVAVAGRVPVAVSPHSAPIHIGDFLSASDIPGKAMKALSSGYTIGKALEDWTPPLPGDSEGQSTVLLLVGTSYYAGELTENDTESTLSKANTTLEQLIIAAQSTTESYLNVMEQTASTIGGTITQSITDAQRIVSDQIITGSQIISPVVTALTVQTKEVQTDIISPLSGNDVSIKLKNKEGSIPDSKFQILNSNNHPVASIDASGSARFEGTVSAPAATFGQIIGDLGDLGDLRVRRDATIAGTLTVGNLGHLGNLKVEKDATIAGTLTATEATISSLFADDVTTRDGKLSDLIERVKKYLEPQPTAADIRTEESSFSGLLAQLQQTPVYEGNNITVSESTQTNNHLTMQPFDHEGMATWLNGYMAAGITPSTILIGDSLYISGQTIDSGEETLHIQRFAKSPVAIMGGQLMIDTDGNVFLNRNLSVLGTVATNTISPLPQGDLTIDLNKPIYEATSSGSFDALLPEDKRTPSRFAKLIINGIGGAPAVTIDASGSARFEGDLAARTGNFNKLIIASDEASTSAQTTINSNASTGTATLPKGINRITIESNAITDQSLIYLTPVSSTYNKVLYVAAKKSRYFGVAIDQTVDRDIEFNWWIIN